jgi:hypothetical protein
VTLLVIDKVSWALSVALERLLCSENVVGCIPRHRAGQYLEHEVAQGERISPSQHSRPVLICVQLLLHVIRSAAQHVVEHDTLGFLILRYLLGATFDLIFVYQVGGTFSPTSIRAIRV